MLDFNILYKECSVLKYYEEKIQKTVHDESGYKYYEREGYG
jgi:hypothetical protein